jgi:hypothetical protein
MTKLACCKSWSTRLQPLRTGLGVLALWLATLVLTLLPRPQAALADEAADLFHESVEPLLRKHCYSCHSHASQQMEGGLALDWKSGWVAGGERGPAIVPGRPEESLLIRAVEHVDADLKMPEDKLDAADIAILNEWIRNGAFDDRIAAPAPGSAEDWWSLRPLVTPSVPVQQVLAFPSPAKAASDPPAPTDGLNPIDAFVRSGLAEVGLEPSPSATPRELIKRVFFDLLGLPPSAEEVSAFEADHSEAAYMRVVDRLLQSPRYGERWSRHWFDTIHFADSHGYEHDVGRDHAWPYRDYVVDALNADLPWQTFIRQQLAVDYFEPHASHLIPALGFLGAGTFDYSTYQTGPVTFDYLDRDDMLTQTMSAFLSTTVHCARCHAHKFDPIPQEDYYALQAVFAGIVKGDLHYDGDAQVAADRHRLKRLVAAAERGDTDLLHAETTRQLVANWESERGTGAEWKGVDAISFISLEGSTLSMDPSGVILASGPAPEIDTYVITATTSLARITAVRLELLPDDSLPMQGPGRCHNGNLHLSEISLAVFPPGAQMGTPVAWAQATADFNQEGWEVHRTLDNDPKTAWGIYPAVGQAHHAVFELAEPIELPAGSTLTITLKQLHGGSHLIGAFRLSVTDQLAPQAAALPNDVQRALDQEATQRSEEQKLAIAQYVVRQTGESQLQSLPPQATVYAAATNVAIPTGSGSSQAANVVAPKVVHLLKRGDIGQPQGVVSPGGLSVLKHLPSRFEEIASHSEAARRAALADWIAHRDNMLTWRSVVNRIWHFHFGRGLCDTPSDFGRMGSVPSQPELLDWLAVWFRDEAAGSLKQLHRLIVTSQTYRQSSAFRQAAVEIDADNKLLWRQNRMRLDADAYRDFVLAVSGRLDLAMGGPAIQHFHQSPGPQLTPKLDYSAYDWGSLGANRRSIYRYVWRGIPDPLMAALDFPDLGLLTPTRSQTASPLQALALFNNNFVLFHSQAMAEQIIANVSDVNQQIASAVERCYQRTISPEEQASFGTYVHQHGLAALCRLLLNSSEFMFIP